MAKSARVISTVKLDKTTLSQKILVETARKGLAEPEVKKRFLDVQKRATKLAAAHYGGMVAQIGGALKDPYFPAAVRRRSFSIDTFIPPPAGVPGAEQLRVPLATGRITAFAWPGLNREYKDATGKWAGLLKSKVFWRKTGELANAYETEVLSKLPKLRNRNSYNKSGVKREPVGRYPYIKTSYLLEGKPVERRRPIARGYFVIDYPPLAGVVDVLVRRSFTSERPQFYRSFIQRELLFQRGSVRGLDRMAYAEYVRPMFARYAANVGNQHREALRSILAHKNLVQPS